MAKTMVRGVELEPIERLGEKVTQLVSVIERLRLEQGRLIEENGRLTRDLQSLEQRIAEAEGSSAELTNLREERDVIRGRVAEMLEQLDALHL